MPISRKRALQEADTSNNAQPPKEPSVLHRIRNMWQFANLFQFILLFGKALKLDDSLDIEDLEAECLKPGSMVLQDIGLGTLKFLSSHRGLTHDVFEEYTRRQFLAKAPEKNPFGTEDLPTKFADFDVFTKIRVLQQMSQLVMCTPERLRERTEEQKDMDQTNWRIEPYGWDSEDRTYFVLDDNRIYRLTEARPPLPNPRRIPKKAKAVSRSSKRRRVSAAVSEDGDAGDEDSVTGQPDKPEDDGLGGMKWECLAVSLDEVRQFLATIQRSKDPNEKILREQIQDHLVPILEKQEESKKRKQLQREKELQALEKMAHAKRSSRIAGKLEQQKAEEQAREEERKRREEEAARRKEEQRQAKMERERERRLMSREQRLKEREVRRLQAEEELAQLSEDSKSVGSGPGRMSERHRQAAIEKNRRALQELQDEEDDWIFDCICGDAEQEDFHFICSSCRRSEAEKSQQPRVIKLKVNRHASSSPPPHQAASDISRSQADRPELVVELKARAVSGSSTDRSSEEKPRSGSQDSPSEQQEAGTEPTTLPGEKKGTARPVTAARSVGKSPGRREMNPFSSPHPTLSPPNQSPGKLRAYDSIFDHSAPFPAVGRENSAHLREEGSLPVLPPPAGNGRWTSPSKQPQRPSSPLGTKSSPAAGARIVSTPLPQLTPVQPDPHARNGAMDRSSPLPPSRGGLSPTKHSPPVPPRHQVNGSVSAGASPSGTGRATPVFPPSAAFAPTPQQQNLAPPVKPVKPDEPAKAQPQP
ncbi:unnamed protein product [Sordaria macrospora k-hell]|uniref:WGS project CABT00000000 data, contig 2.19 n=1 Tax=Sordaria macrospora (strain ATCC MYA-333 / DSM 997 / K(L3346) / K-hell) TaxID=771870 RepID=F7W1A9_SORMK|nr:uncharacterized protein SMAC_04251 [Sordaria macrospora k-hell]CCC04884.1 unnamed protein product [Sordaria macrospora k-hell]